MRTIVDKTKYPWDRTRIYPDSTGGVYLTQRQFETIRKHIQEIETIVDGATQQKKINKRRLALALSRVRSIQSLYFPQLNYSLYYFRGNKKIGEQHPSKQNYRKYKRERDLEKVKKL